MLELAFPASSGTGTHPPPKDLKLFIIAGQKGGHLGSKHLPAAGTSLCRISAREDEFLEGDGINCFERKGETSLHFCDLLIKADSSVFGLETLFCMYSTTQTQCRYSQCR